MEISKEEYMNALFIVKQYENPLENTWQLCPLCNGHSDPTHIYPCKICKGEKLISKQTGLPIKLKK
jgi:DnaJ-class molecular chaperone